MTNSRRSTNRRVDKTMYYEVGNMVQFSTDSGGIVTATVIARVDRLWDGQPGFIGADADGARAWGLDSEIVAVGAIADPDQQ
jgi:hypothetical protein